jgi:hypothetical protein
VAETYRARALTSGRRSYRMSFTPVNGPARDSIALRNIGEAALALHVSGAALSKDMTPEQIAAAIVTGVRTVGMAALIELSELETACNLGTAREMFGTTRAPWSNKRSELCIGLADHLSHALQPVFTTSTPVDPGPVLTVRVARSW